MTRISKWHIFDGKFKGDLEEHIIRLPNCRPFSINKAYYKQTFNMTRECRQWRETIINALKEETNQLIINSFKNKFDETKHGIQIVISHRMPKEWFFTKKEIISRRSQDITNIEKLLVDILFDSRFYERGEINNLNIDDKFIVSMLSEKIFTKANWGIIVKLDLINLDRYK